ncbi:hypothetical protein AVEN_163066-1 [Araneus ventricosus]|uniref:Uncharacterized protein n=1 Tax=Araneus ventricosus TaxID=182803 RepID=A0A4Y2NZA9_ARAVE|nr:hypothetical protein AVEN_163066-1 [Araneus ventricosus]
MQWRCIQNCIQWKCIQGAYSAFRVHTVEVHSVHGHSGSAFKLRPSGSAFKGVHTVVRQVHTVEVHSRHTVEIQVHTVMHSSAYSGSAFKCIQWEVLHSSAYSGSAFKCTVGKCIQVHASGSAFKVHTVEVKCWKCIQNCIQWRPFKVHTVEDIQVHTVEARQVHTVEGAFRAYSGIHSIMQFKCVQDMMGDYTFKCAYSGSAFKCIQWKCIQFSHTVEVHSKCMMEFNCAVEVHSNCIQWKCIQVHTVEVHSTAYVGIKL